MKNLLAIIGLSIVLALSLFFNAKQCSTTQSLYSKLDDCQTNLLLAAGPGSMDTIRDTVTISVTGNSTPDIPKPERVDPVPIHENATASNTPAPVPLEPVPCDSIRTYRIPHIDSVLSYTATVKTRGYLEDFNLRWHIDKTTLKETITKTVIKTDTVREVKREPLQLFLTGGIGSDFTAPQANTLEIGGMAVINRYGVGYEYETLQGIHQLKLAIKLD